MKLYNFENKFAVANKAFQSHIRTNKCALYTSNGFRLEKNHKTLELHLVSSAPVGGRTVGVLNSADQFQL